MSKIKDGDSLGESIIDLLVEAGVTQAFTVPGDFVVRFCEILAASDKLDLVTMSHEPSAAFGAMGASLATSRVAVLVTTYGVGALNVVNAIAGAYAERIPVVVISGAPGVKERSYGIALHHQVRSYQTQRRIFDEITAFQAILDDPTTAKSLVTKAISICQESSLPVYIEIPRDMVDQLISSCDEPQTITPCNTLAIEQAAEELIRRIQLAQSPVFVIGTEILRYNLSEKITQLAEMLAIPMVSTFTGHSAIPERHPLFAGTYLGSASSTEWVQKLVKGSDCLLFMGDLNTDTNMGIAYAVDPDRLIHVLGGVVATSTVSFVNVPITRLVEKLITMNPDIMKVKSSSFPSKRFDVAADTPILGPLSPSSMVAEINRILVERPTTVAVDVGDCMFTPLEISVGRLLALNFYMSMGFALPAAIGYQLATGGDRPLVILGDGSFQMTGFEIANAIKLGVSPIVIVMNNSSWQTLKAYGNAPFSDLANWKYADMAKLWGCRAKTVSTATDFREAFEDAFSIREPILIEAILSPQETTRTNKSFSSAIRSREHLPNTTDVDFQIHSSFAAQRNAMK